jgi:hypothetical protein
VSWWIENAPPIVFFVAFVALLWWTGKKIKEYDE